MVYASIDLMQIHCDGQITTEDRPAARHISRHVCRRSGVVHQQGAMLACAPVLARQRHHAARGCLHACSARVRLTSKLTAALAGRNCKWQHSCPDRPLIADVAGSVRLQLAAGSCIGWPTLASPGILRLCQPRMVCQTLSAEEAQTCKVPCWQASGKSGLRC